MDAVKSFNVEVDLACVSTLYDYRRGEFLKRPTSGWDLHELTSAFRKTVEFDETTANMMSKLYKVHLEKGRFEGDKTKDANEEEDEKKKLGWIFDNISGAEDSDLSLPPYVLPVLKPGDPIRGQVQLEVAEEIEADSINIKFKGHASTNVQMYNGQTSYPDRGEVVYAYNEIVAWQKEGGDLKDEDEGVLISNKLQTGKTLTPGKYTFPYDFKLPLGAVGSVPPFVSSCCDYAYLTYYIKATIKRGKTFKRGNVVANQGLWVVKPIDLAKDPENMKPVNEEREQTTGIFTKGKVVCRASLPCRGFILGTDNHVPLRLEVDNQSGGEINSVKAYVSLKGHYRAKANKWHCTRSSTIKGHKVEEGAIASGMSPQFNLKLPLEFRENGVDGNLIPAGTLDDCSIIDVNYDVCIILKRSGMHRNVEMKIPIFLGTENSSSVAGSVYPSLESMKIN